MAKRATNIMPDDVRAKLSKAGLLEAYGARPHYQRNDYLGWISRAKGDDTRESRIAQMLAELKQGGVYMGMAHKPSAKS